MKTLRVEHAIMLTRRIGDAVQVPDLDFNARLRAHRDIAERDILLGDLFRDEREIYDAWVLRHPIVEDRT